MHVACHAMVCAATNCLQAVTVSYAEKLMISNVLEFFTAHTAKTESIVNGIAGIEYAVAWLTNNTKKDLKHAQSNSDDWTHLKKVPARDVLQVLQARLAAMVSLTQFYAI